MFSYENRTELKVITPILHHLSEIRGRKRGSSAQKSNNLNGIFLFSKHANLTNIWEWFEIPKERKWVSKPVKLQLCWTLTRTRSSFFKIVLLHCRLVQDLLIERSNSIKTPKRIHKIISNALLQLTISTHKAYRLDGQLFSKTKEALKETCDPTIVTLTWIIWFELPKRSTFSTLGFQHTQIQPLLEWS
jgi:hypothetical protein